VPTLPMRHLPRVSEMSRVFVGVTCESPSFAAHWAQKPSAGGVPRPVSDREFNEVQKGGRRA
jgi:hypothetical protein